MPHADLMRGENVSLYTDNCTAPSVTVFALKDEVSQNFKKSCHILLSSVSPEVHYKNHGRKFN